MGRKQELAEQMAALQEELDAMDGDGDDELWIRSGDHETRVPASRAGKWLQEHFGITLHDDPGDGDGDGDGDQEPEDKKPASGGYFSKRKG